MATPTLFDSGIFSVIGLNSELLIGAELYWFVAETSTPAPTYSNPELTIANANPVPFDNAGRLPQIWLGAGPYKYVLVGPDGDIDSPLVTVDKYTPSGGYIDAVVTGFAASTGAGLVGFSQDETYAQGTVGNHLTRSITVTDAPFNATGDGVADDSDAIEEAIAFASPGKIYLPAGTYKTTRNINFAPVSVEGDGAASIIAPTQAGIGIQIGYTNPEGGINTFDKSYNGFRIQANSSTTLAFFEVAMINSAFSNITVLYPSDVPVGYASFRTSGGDYGNTYKNLRSRCEALAVNARGFWMGNGQNEAGGPFASTNVNTYDTCYSTNAAIGFDLDYCTNSVLINPVSEGGDIMVRGFGNTIIAPFLDGGDMIFDYYYPADGSGGVGPATKPYNNVIVCGSLAFNAILNQSIAASFSAGALVNLTIGAGATSTKSGPIAISGTYTNNGTNSQIMFENGGLNRMFWQSGSNTVLDIVAGANSVDIKGPDGRALIFRAGGLDTEMTLNARPFVLSGTQPQLQLPAVAVGALPAAATYRGLRGTVTDSNAAASGNFGAIVANGGANVVPVFSDGTNWRIG